MNGRRAFRSAGIVFGIVIAVLAVLLIGLSFVDWNAMRGPIVRYASEKAGKPIRIHGDLRVHLFSLTPSVTVNALEVGNPRWAGEGNLAEVGRATVKLRLAPLLIGRLTFQEARIERSRVNLLTNEEGVSNWSSPRQERTRGAPRFPVIHRFELERTQVSYIDRRRDLDFEGIVAADELRNSDDPRPFRLAAIGTMNGRPFRLIAQGGALVNVRRNRPYPCVAEVFAGPTRARAEGAITRPFDFGRFRAKVSMSGDDLADLFHLTGIALPNSPPYEVSADFAREGTLVKVQNLQGRVGDSDLTGDLDVELKGRRPFVEATLASRSLDLDDMAALFGAPPSTKEGETASPEQQRQQQKLVAARRLLPDAKLKVERVKAMDAHVRYRAPEVRSGRFPLRSLDIDVRLNDGVLTLEPVAFRMPQGNVSATVRIDARPEVPAVALDARLADIDLEQFKPKKSPTAPVGGMLRGRIELDGEGDSVRAFAASSKGVATFVVPKGEVREAFAELTGINVARGLGLLVRKDQEKTLVRCGVAAFKVSDGTLHAETIVFDTDNVVITGEGTVNLREEQFDLSIRGHPKKLRFLRVRSPISVEGPLRRPSVGLEGGEAAGQTGIAAALGALVTPVAAVIAFVDPGLAEDANCSALLNEAKKAGAPVKTAEARNADDDSGKKPEKR